MKIFLGCLLLVFYLLLRKQQKKEALVPPPITAVVKPVLPSTLVKAAFEDPKTQTPSPTIIEIPKDRRIKPRSRLARLLLAKEILERRG